MDSKTPAMSFSVEYETTITDGNDDKVEFIVKNVDFGIVERAKQLMDISKRVSAFKITLANGQVLMDAEVTEDGKLKGSHSNLSYMGPTNTNGINVNGILRAELDSELIEGATVEVTYAIKVTNVSEKDYDSPNYYLYGNKKGAQLIKNSVTGVIDYLDGKIVFVPDVLYHYYLRYDSQIHNINMEDVNNFKKLLEVKEFYKKHNKYEEMKNILDLMAFIHLGVSVMYRASYDPSIDTKKMMKETLQYLDENFGTWRKSPFLTFRYSVKKGFKHVGLWGISVMYKMGLYMLFIKIYRFLVDKLKIDIKF